MQSGVYVMHVTSLEYLSQAGQNSGNLEKDINIFVTVRVGGRILKSVEDTRGLACKEIKIMEFYQKKRNLSLMVSNV